jgi:hypothetical protein
MHTVNNHTNLLVQYVLKKEVKPKGIVGTKAKNGSQTIILGSVYVSASERWMAVWCGRGMLLCMCGSGANFLYVKVSPIVSRHKKKATHY